MQVIPEKDKRIAINEFLYLYDGLPARSMLTGEYLWPLRPQETTATCSPRLTRVSKRASDSNNEESGKVQQRKRSAPWNATDQALTNKRRTAERKARHISERSTSCDSKHSDSIRMYLSEMDDEIPKAIGMHLVLVTYVIKRMVITLLIYVIICRLEGSRRAML